MTGKTNCYNDWVVDFGSTEHITHAINILESRTKNHCERLVLIPNGEIIPIEGEREYILPSGSKLKGVLHIPKFTCNILSMSQL